MFDSEQQIHICFLKGRPCRRNRIERKRFPEHYGSNLSRAMKELWNKERCIDIQKLVGMTEQFNTVKEFCDFAGDYIEPNFFPNFKRIRQKSVLRKAKLIGQVDEVNEKTIEFVSGLKEEMEKVYSKSEEEDPTIGLSFMYELDRRERKSHVVRIPTLQ